MHTWIWTVGYESPTERLDKAVTTAILNGLGVWSPEDEQPELSRSRLQKLIEEGRVTLNGRPALARDKIQPGDQITLLVPDPEALNLTPEDSPLEILYEDHHIAVINKPAGLTVHPSETQRSGTLVNILLHKIKDLSGVGGVLRPGIVHRLDKDTSGALVITKTDEAHHKLSETFASHEIERRYWALCYGAPHTTAETKIESLIGRSSSDRKKMSAKVTDGRKAVTYCRMLEHFVQRGKTPFASLIEARLETGRTHQVRVHLTEAGLSLLGDPVYGTPSDGQGKWRALPAEIQKAVRALSGQALHARILGFKHPITGEALRFEAQPPPEFQALLNALRNENRHKI